MSETPSNGHLPDPDLDSGNEFSQDPFEQLGEFLEEDGWYPQRLEDRTAYRVYFSGHNGEFRCYAQIHRDLSQFIFYAVAPIKVPEEARAAAAEYITRANYGLRIGNFELDYADGEVRYKSSLDYEGSNPGALQFKNVIYPAVQTLDRYLKGLMEVIFGGKSPAAAICEVEGAES